MVPNNTQEAVTMKPDFAHAEPLAKAFFDVSFDFSQLPENFFPEGADVNEVRDYLRTEAEYAFLAGAKWLYELSVMDSLAGKVDQEAEIKVMEMYAHVMSDDPRKPGFVAEFNQQLLFLHSGAFFSKGAGWAETYRTSRGDLN
jgi:hypothetical protein